MFLLTQLFTSELIPTGVNFLKSDNEALHTVTCELSDPSSWNDYKVEFTVYAISDGSKKRKCTKEKNSNFESSDCTGEGNPVFDARVPDKNMMSVKITQTHKLTVIYRCDVKVTNEDSEATDSTLIHAEAIDVYIIYNMDYKFMDNALWVKSDGSATTASLEIGINGDDDAPTLDITELKIEYKVNGDAKAQTGKLVLNNELTEDSLQITVESIKSTDEAVSRPVGKDIYLYKVCKAGQYFDTDTKSCKSCAAGYRDTSMDQFLGCQNCRAGMCPNKDFTGCRKIQKTEIYLGGYKCNKCPAGTKPNSHNLTCENCPVGTAGELCQSCGSSSYAPSEGLPQCLSCNGVVNDNKCGQCQPGQGQKTVGNVQRCEECPIGQESPYGTCLDCKSGTYSNVAGSTSCKDCKKGYHQSEKHKSTCDKCPENTFSAEEGASECTSVQEGYIAIVEGGENTGQQPCEVGQFQTFDGAIHVCKDCNVQLGEYQPEEGQKDCMKVTPGHKVTTNGKGQEACLEGTVSGDGDNSDLTKCIDCIAVKGSYSRENKTTACTKVPVGHKVIADAKGNGVDYSPCEPGTSGNNLREDYTKCTACNDKYYQDKSSMETCNPLPTGYIAIVQNNLYTGIKKCPDGQEAADHLTCKECREGYYKGPSAVECQPVKAGFISVDRITVTKCRIGEFELNGKCSDCNYLKGQYQNLDGQSECARIKNGEGFVYATDDNGEPTEPKKNDDGTIVVRKCLKGEFSTGPTGKHPFRCKKCNVDIGEYQDTEQMPYCKIAVPGYQLNGDEPATTPIRECLPGTFSKGSSKVCDRCDPVRKQYQNTKGSAYCKICNHGQVKEDINGNGVDCIGLRCEETTETKAQIRDKPFIFTATSAGEYLSIPCQEQDTSSEDVSSHEETVIRLCKYDHRESTAYWKPADYTKCRTKKTKEFEKLQREVESLSDTENLEKMEPDKIASSLDALRFQLNSVTGGSSEKRTGGESTDKVGMTARDVTDAITTLSDFSSVLSAINSTDEQVVAAKAEMEKQMVHSIADVGKTDSDSLKTVKPEAKAKMVAVVEKLADDINGVIETPVLSVEHLDISGAQKRMASRSSDGDSGNPHPTSTNIPLPKPTGMEAREQPTLELDPNNINSGSVAVFSKDSKDMFPDPDEGEETTEVGEEESDAPASTTAIDSCVVSLNLKPSDGKNLDFKLRMKIDPSNDTELKKKKMVERTCSFLNLETQKWSSVGCVTVGPDEDGYIQCQCNHTTSFAILLSISDIDDKTQDIVSEYFFYLNASFLLLTFICTVSFTQRRLMVLQNQLVLALFLGNVGFHLLSKLTKVNVDELAKPLYNLNMGCYTGVVAVQYLFLVAVSWMTACSYTLHSKIVDAIKTFGKNDPFYLLKCFIACWGLPALLPTSGFLVSYYLNDFTKDPMIDWPMPYIPAKQNASCWVESPWKWVTFMIPCYICILMNCGVFLMITRVMIRASKRGSSGQGFGRQVKALITMSVTVGVPWIVGMLTFEPIKDVGQWLFIILTGLQGPVMFVMMVLLQGEVLSAILRPCGVQPPEWLSQSSKMSLRKQSSAHHTVTESILARDKPYDPKGIDPETAVALEDEKRKHEEKKGYEDNVYCNQAADDKTPLEPPSDSKCSSEDHTYYECTHFPSNTGSQETPPLVTE